MLFKLASQGCLAAAFLLLTGCMMAAAPLLGGGMGESSQDAGGEPSAPKAGQAMVAVYSPEDAKLDCEQIGAQIKQAWSQMAETEMAVRGESRLALHRKSQRPRLENLQKRYNRLLEMAREKNCAEWERYGPMIIGETEGIERVGKAAQGDGVAR